MSKSRRVVIFIALFVLLLLIFWYFKGVALPNDNIGIILFSALVLLSFVSLFIEHFFTAPTDVIASTISILLLLSPLKDAFQKLGIWYSIFYIYNLALLLISLVALLLLNEKEPRSSSRNKLSDFLKITAVFLGNGKFLYFALFILTMLFYVNNQSRFFIVLFGYSVVILLVNPKKYMLQLTASRKNSSLEIGTIFGVQSKNTFLVKLYENRSPVNLFDFVEFKYSMGSKGKIYKGMIVDNYLLNQEQWIKVLLDSRLTKPFQDKVFGKINQENVVCKISTFDVPEILEKFVGTVIDKSNISKIRFHYSSKTKVSEGQLLEVYVDDKVILYQIIEGITEIETLELKNQTGFVVGEAIQLGIWDNKKTSFEKYGWVPDINTPVYLASSIKDVKPTKDEYIIGKIPGTNYPVIIKKIDAITHHLGILGVTGSGKSVFARNLIGQIMKDGVKIICVDFTNEYLGKLGYLSPSCIIPPSHSDRISGTIDQLALEMAKFENQRDARKIEKMEAVIEAHFYDAIKSFLISDNDISIFELPDISNTTGILEYTKWFFYTLFLIARTKGNFGKRLCVVLEEAHTVIPEWNFIGISEKKSQSLVNSIGQIALQGRKYNIGFIVIAQRTANVSKTVLTQCNSIIAFQEFDNTSREFLSNYLGKDMVNALPNLKFRQAIAVGKAFKSNIPLIFEVPIIKES